MDKLILDHIPQRDPFLFIEEVISRGENSITTSKRITGDEEFFKGHFPGRPVFPGVLMCEACFQTGALLMALKGAGTGNNKTAVVTRIQGTKFKNIVRPGDLLHIMVELVEEVANAAFMKGKISCEGKTIMTIEFSCAVIPNEEV